MVIAMLLPALAVTFAAFCVWLTVRIVNRRERWAIRTAIVMAVLFFLGLFFVELAKLIDYFDRSRVRL